MQTTFHFLHSLLQRARRSCRPSASQTTAGLQQQIASKKLRSRRACTAKVKLEAELAAVMTELAAAELAEAAELAAVTTDLAAAKLTEAADVSDA